jgi:hypothetical protein
VNAVQRAHKRTSAFGGGRLRSLVLLSGVSILVLLAFFVFRAPRSNTSMASPSLGNLRGERIEAPIPTNLAPMIAANEGPPAENSETTHAKRKHPKPTSFQHRIVEFQISQLEGTNAETTTAFGGNPAKVIFTPEQLAALRGPPMPPGCEEVGFARLSGFPFEVTREMADGTKNLAAASAATRKKIPKDVQALDNHLVAIRGFLLPLKMNDGLTIEFLLMRNQNTCCFGSVPKINEWVSVQPEGAGVKPIMDQPITVIGKLRVGEIRENDYLVGIYRIQGAQVSLPSN